MRFPVKEEGGGRVDWSKVGVHFEYIEAECSSLESILTCHRKITSLQWTIIKQKERERGRPVALLWPVIVAWRKEIQILAGAAPHTNVVMTQNILLLDRQGQTGHNFVQTALRTAELATFDCCWTLRARYCQCWSPRSPSALWGHRSTAWMGQRSGWAGKEIVKNNNIVF